ncbi:serine-type endopeptidase-like protein [Xylona heveae TC161]|uniref:Serine-type endopeptidase-like protein n=1 Tax=Xylona heveae (strain CBS 132557 / TC161) TaxID=1328760 RepID=A0A165H686_XYLHT|nr:serine-type endopeptidase-like protein [Xylona heveae TC161]KZF23044.1 serine-type endopeptidase-like protein [Xylona heveae TC161]
MRSFLTLSLLPLIASASPVLNVGTIHNEAAPILSSSQANEVPDSYIVVFKKHVSHTSAAAHHDWVQDIHLSSEDARTELRKRSQTPFTSSVFEGLKHTYNIGNGALLGYSGHFDENVIEQVRKHPDVDYIERDAEVHTMGGSLEKNAPWGLARISHRDSLSFGTFNKYLYSEDGGEGVDVYIIDTGTNVDHVDFEGRAAWGKTIPVNDADEDGNGHGTHCSGTVAGKKFGVAKKANVIAVKVLRSNGSGTMSDVVKGVEYAAESHIKKVEAAKGGKSKKFKGSAANMSLGGGKSVTLDLAVNAAVDAGIHFAVAAGNDNADSCNYSPAAAEKAVTVGASTLADERAYFSNYGKCNDIFAPGLNIQSTWIGSKYAVNTISGTSMASPHIAGLLAYFLSLQPSKDSAYAVADITPKKLKANLISIATEGALADVPSNTKNILAWNGGGSSNYTEIVEEGGYLAKTKDTNTVLIPTAEIEAELVSAGHKVVSGSEKLADKAEKLSEKIEELVAKELKGIFEELRAD